MEGSDETERIVFLLLLLPLFSLFPEGYSKYTPRPLVYRGETYRGTTETCSTV
jgi:hypothetical protein